MGLSVVSPVGGVPVICQTPISNVDTEKRIVFDMQKHEFQQFSCL
jgi:hypothetical protein